MKNPSIPLLIAGSLFATASAQTTYDGADRDTVGNLFITTAGNWDNGLPIGQQGTINIDAGFNHDTEGALVGYDILHTGGTFSRTSGNSGLSLNGSTWEMNGAGAEFNGNHRGISLSNSSSFILTNGSYTISESNRDVVVGSSSSLTINGGSFSAQRSMKFDGGATYTQSAGTVSTNPTGAFGQAGFTVGSATFNFNGGSLSGQRFAFQQSGTAANFGGSTAGMVTFDDWGTGNGLGNNGDRVDDRNIFMNFNAGSLMTLSMGSTTRELDFDDDNVGDAGTHWAEALWQTGRMTYTDGATIVSGFDPAASGWSIVSWSDATTDTVGLGTASNEYFDFTAAGTYGGSLVLAVIPEPSSIALVGMALLSLLALRRRKA